MSDTRPRNAMVLGAGLGTRMRPLTDSRPKPLIPVQGRAMLDRILDRLEAAGIGEAVINLHHLGKMIEAHLSDRARPRIAYSREATLLDTGGGVRQALPLLGPAPFYAVNGDVCWLDGCRPALRRLADAWDDATMDALLLLHPTAFAIGYAGPGDFVLSAEGCVRRRGEREIAPFVFAGVQVLHPRLFADAPEGAFSLNVLYDRAAENGRLWGLRHDGEWLHIGTPAQLCEAEAALHHSGFRTVQR